MELNVNLMTQNRIKRSTKTKIFNLLLVVLFCTAFVLIISLMVMGSWKSSTLWLVSLGFTAYMLFHFYRFFPLKMFKILGVCVLAGFMMVIPSFVALSAMDYNSVAQLIDTEKEKSYFQNVLDRDYDYRELIEWEWQHIAWLEDSEPNPQRNSDPIEIYEYGKGKCREFAILYAELCLSQGYQCRLVSAPINDHAWTEVNINGEWTRVDASLGPNDTRAIDYPMFFEKEKGWNPPIIALAFDGSSIVDVTSTYRSDGWSLFSLINIFFIGLALWFSFCLYLIFKKKRKSVIAKLI